ncbi:MAG: hypothetical protein C5B50_03375 [Verrucomicrobia bacterium]|nr:MAG: hypothetical protein C5B50_03375 [Verrucomicrobiota bacterium]
MNSEFPIDPRQELEAKLTALLLGELSPEEAAAVQQSMAQDPELAGLYSRLEQTIGLVREATAAPVQQPAAPESASLKLADERREALLQHFKTVAPREFEQPRRGKPIWLNPVAVAAVVLVTAALAVMLFSSTQQSSKTESLVARSGGARQEAVAKNEIKGMDTALRDLQDQSGSTPVQAQNRMRTVRSQPPASSASAIHNQEAADWAFPTQRFPNVGVVGQVHRGTPWQTELQPEGLAEGSRGSPAATPGARGLSPSTPAGVQELADSTTTLSGGATVAQTAPPPSKPATGNIVLPSTEPATGGVYSQQIVGYVNVAKPENYNFLSTPPASEQATFNGAQETFQRIPGSAATTANSYADNLGVGQWNFGTGGGMGGGGGAGTPQDTSKKSPKGDKFDLAWGGTGGKAQPDFGFYKDLNRNGRFEPAPNDVNGPSTTPAKEMTPPTVTAGGSVLALTQAQTPAIDPTTGLPEPLSPPSATVSPVDPTTGFPMSLDGALATPKNDPATGMPIASLMPAAPPAQAAERPYITGIGGVLAGDSVKAPLTASPTPSTAPAQQLETRTFHVDPNTFRQGLESVVGVPFAAIVNDDKNKAPGSTPRVSVAGSVGNNGLIAGGLGGGAPGTGGGIGGQSGIAAQTRTDTTTKLNNDVRQFYNSLGVDLSGSKSVAYNDRDGTITVRGTAQDLETIAQANDVLSAKPPEVALKAKFADATTESAKAPLAASATAPNITTDSLFAEVPAPGSSADSSATPARAQPATGLPPAGPPTVYFSTIPGLKPSAAPSSDEPVSRISAAEANAMVAKRAREAETQNQSADQRRALGFDWYAGNVLKQTPQAGESAKSSPLAQAEPAASLPPVLTPSTDSYEQTPGLSASTAESLNTRKPLSSPKGGEIFLGKTHEAQSQDQFADRLRNIQRHSASSGEEPKLASSSTAERFYHVNPEPSSPAASAPSFTGAPAQAKPAAKASGGVVLPILGDLPIEGRLFRSKSETSVAEAEKKVQEAPALTPPTTSNLEGSNAPIAAWMDASQHGRVGNITLADGNVQGLTLAKLREALSHGGDAYSNLLMFPDDGGAPATPQTEHGKGSLTAEQEAAMRNAEAVGNKLEFSGPGANASAPRPITEYSLQRQAKGEQIAGTGIGTATTGLARADRERLIKQLAEEGKRLFDDGKTEEGDAKLREAQKLAAPDQTTFFLKKLPSEAERRSGTAEVTSPDGDSRTKLNLDGANASQVMELYGKLLNKKVLRGGTMPEISVTLKDQEFRTKEEATRALGVALGLNGITVIQLGDGSVKAVPNAQAFQEAEQWSQNRAKSAAEDAPKPKPVAPPPVPQPEVQTKENAISTFSLNVSDVSFKLAAASLEKGVMPEPASIRSEEFINAFDYRDPEAAPGAPVAFAWERAAYPFAQNRDLLRFSIKTAAQGREQGRPMNIVLLMDNSGSMERADRVQIIREALRVLARQLQAQDRLSIVTFARTARLVVDGAPGSQAAQVVEQVSGLTPEGGTNLEEAMNTAYETALRHYLPGGINRVVLLTDGAANLGNVQPEELKKKVEANRKQGIALDCFGIGWEGYNDDLLEVLTRNGDGRYGFVNTPEEAATDFAGQLAGALQVAASDVKVQVEFNPARVTAYRQIGYAKHQLTKEQFRDNSVNAAQIGAAEAGNALYVIEVNPAGEGPVATVRLRYRLPGTNDYREQEWVVPYLGSAVALEKVSPAMRLAATASAFSEWLATSPYATEVTPDRLLGYLSGVPEVYGADGRPKKLEWMVRQARGLNR